MTKTKLTNDETNAGFYGALSCAMGAITTSFFVNSAIERSAFLSRVNTQASELTDKVLTSIQESSKLFEQSTNDAYWFIGTATLTGFFGFKALYHATRQEP